MKTLFLTLIIAIITVTSFADDAPPVVPPIHIPQWQCHYEINGQGQLEKVCGFY